ncbi:uncharacterized protein LOC135100542 isoform X2 [Scylla paramamosain]|uniref:uncharacterized protein LOC135100542 isoform X2 n=1 Tax=Scylla paramamosain TaxID=85552 RepID=UPI003082B586
MTSRAQSSEDQWKKWRRNSGIRYSGWCAVSQLHLQCGGVDKHRPQCVRSVTTAMIISSIFPVVWRVRDPTYRQDSREEVLLQTMQNLRFKNAAPRYDCSVYSCCGFPFLHFLLSVHRLRNIIISSSLNASTKIRTLVTTERWRLGYFNCWVHWSAIAKVSTRCRKWDIRVRASSYHSSSVTPWTQRRGFPAANTQECASTCKANATPLISLLLLSSIYSLPRYAKLIACSLFICVFVYLFLLFACHFLW